MHLVVSKNKATWKLNDRNIFAGKWCYSNNEIDKKSHNFLLYDEIQYLNFDKIDNNWRKIFKIKG